MDEGRISQGGCMCGDVRYEAVEEPRAIGHCHCHSCRRHFEEITDVDRWVQDRLEVFLNDQEPHEQHLSDGRWLLCRESHTSDGGIVGIRTDITERKRTEQELRESEELFSLTFHASPVLAAISRPKDGAHFNVNKAWIETTGYSYEEAIAHAPRRRADTSVKNDPLICCSPTLSCRAA